MMKCTASFGYAGRDYDSLRSLVCFVLSILLRFSRTLGDSQWRYLNHRFRTLLHGSRTPNHRFGLVLSVLTPRGFSFAVCKKRYMLSHISLFGGSSGTMHMLRICPARPPKPTASVPDFAPFC